MKPAIRVENLSKCYRIGTQTHPAKRNLTEALAAGARGLWRGLTSGKRAEADGDGTFWALKDVSFEVQPGEVVGIIGRNGAGKSTLLKVLSRIVEPTGGWCEVRGRIGSLLEVGTGFHPELTGRENVLLSGSILGMSRREILSKLHEIIAFSEIEEFVDVPVKRYSSGMYVRLAFAVAAHLETDVLIVDEVIAVGDAQFQQRCLGRMDELGKEGRTVLFVTHNMDAMCKLCTQGIVLTKGRNSPPCSTSEGIRQYYGSLWGASRTNAAELPRAIRCERSPIVRGVVIDAQEDGPAVIPCGAPVRIRVTLANLAGLSDVVCGIALVTELGNRVAFFHSLYHAGLQVKGANTQVLYCDVPSLPLTPGRYYLEVNVGQQNLSILERVEHAAVLTVEYKDVFGTGYLPNQQQGNVVLPAKWWHETTSAVETTR
jgi:lipopolysaccharide transport system ATP-binding protein